MTRRSKTRQTIDILASRGSLFILGVITIWLGASVAKEAYHKHQVQQEIARLKAEIIATEQRNKNLASLIDSFNSPENVETEAKRRLNLKKPGEEVAVILRDKKNEVQNIVQRDSGVYAPDIPKDIGIHNDLLNNPAKWWRYITE